ncbi:MAG: hypothetical protein KDF58_04260 [Alphaproteobacteria bacterium]|nr:hypothetical protein [Alphaproteobacteria bacterium]
MPNRECGDCTICCHHIPINQPDFVKLPNVNCEHLLKNGGCSIYQTRPATCAGWYCGWRHSEVFKDDWRPDKLGALIEISLKGIPNDFPAKEGIVIKIIDRQNALSNDDFMKFIAIMVSRGTAVTLSYGLEPGCSAASTFLNRVLKPAVEIGTKDAVMGVINQIMDDLEKFPKKKYRIEDGKLLTD